jgi:hypothetical protein
MLNAVEKIGAAQRLLAEGVRELAAALAPDGTSGALTRFEEEMRRERS